jgi:hypothetical protein
MLGLPSRYKRVWTIVPHMRRCVKSLTLPRYTWVVGFISLEQTSSLKSTFCGRVRLNGLYHGIKAGFLDGDGSFPPG